MSFLLSTILLQITQFKLNRVQHEFFMKWEKRKFNPGQSSIATTIKPIHKIDLIGILVVKKSISIGFIKKHYIAL